MVAGLDVEREEITRSGRVDGVLILSFSFPLITTNTDRCDTDDEKKTTRREEEEKKEKMIEMSKESLCRPSERPRRDTS